MSADEPLAPPAKQDPETLVLRARPRPVVRFRRGLVIGSAAALSAGLIAVTWTALDPPSFRLAAGGDQPAPAKAGPPDALAGAPASYGDVPQLGPPLPGDLGRPILEHQRSLEAQGQVLPASVPPIDTAELERQRAIEAERQRLVAAEQAARASGVLVQRTQSTHATPPGQMVAPSAVSQTPPGDQATAAPEQAGRSSSGPQIGAANPARLTIPVSPWTLTAGTIIPASLITGLNSDLPGLVLAQVTEPVRDSGTGRTILIPQGARLIGRYDNVVAFGQRRALLVWQRIVLPDGASMELDNMPATDLAGFAGVEDRVDFHTWRLLKGIALSTLLGVGTELSLGSAEGDLVRAVRESAQQNAARAGDQITQRNLDVQPTLRVRPGWPVRAVLHRDLILRPWRS